MLHCRIENRPVARITAGRLERQADAVRLHDPNPNSSTSSEHFGECTAHMVETHGWRRVVGEFDQNVKPFSPTDTNWDISNSLRIALIQLRLLGADASSDQERSTQESLAFPFINHVANCAVRPYTFRYRTETPCMGS